MKERIIDRDMVRRFELYMKEEEHEGATVEKYRRDVLKFIQFTGSDSLITKETAIDYKQWLRECYELSSAESCGSISGAEVSPRGACLSHGQASLWTGAPSIMP